MTATASGARALVPAYRQIVIFCPEAVTGGPEALHQLGHAIAGHGGPAGLVYTGPISHLSIEGDVVVCNLNPDSAVYNAFSVYDPNVLARTTLDARTLIVYPEIMTKLASTMSGAAASCARAIWWLSVNSAFHSNPQFNDNGYRRDYFADTTLLHFYQSAFARDFLKENGAINCYPLFDYTDQNFVHQFESDAEFVSARNRIDSVAYFPRKGGHLARSFVDSPHWKGADIKFIPIENMSKSEVARTLFNTKIYIDFGQNPGKDRVPREAAIAGAIVLLNNTGAAINFEDHPLDGFYKFSESDIHTGELQKKVLNILADPDIHYDKQRIYRQRICLEREEFSLQVRTLFFSCEPGNNRFG